MPLVAWRNLFEGVGVVTERERAILMLAQQCKSTKKIADDLCRGCNTIRNQLKPLFSKLGVHSMQKVINFAPNHRMLYVSKQAMPKHKQQSIEAPRKRTRILITDDMKQRIQQYLDDHMSMRQAAKIEGISANAIRYWIKKEELIN